LDSSSNLTSEGRFGFSSHTPAIVAQYGLSSGPTGCFTPSQFPPVLYTTWLPPHDRVTYIQSLKENSASTDRRPITKLPPQRNLHRVYAGYPASIHLLKSETRSASQGSSGGIDPAQTAPYVFALAGTRIHAGSSRSIPIGFIQSRFSSRKRERISFAKLRAISLLLDGRAITPPAHASLSFTAKN
jgi:hypothetical protein